MTPFQYLTATPHPVVACRAVSMIDEHDDPEIKPCKPVKNTMRRHILKHLQEHGATEWEVMYYAMNGRCIRKSFIAMIRDLRRSGAIEVTNEPGGNFLRLSIVKLQQD